ncbi:AAA family ATPase [Taibaiella lutea]|uniref:AAA family ATPase n=1 Tax=Taibaiella lutea TaxID=2608001 RepID=A0A5M6CFJ5_9BACT|nr:AAA family ATPase [Taibaiella lutea]KAA5532692.1 AAA family ATPase [Taibaiella lutea]
MKLILKSLRITNFKGISDFSIQFNEKENFVFGANGSGKTTISDAYHWLMTGKNSNDEKDFEIKPIDQSGNRSQKLDNIVEGVFEMDGEEITLKKVHSEKWKKPKGQLEDEFKGNETTYFYNGVPVNMKEYQLKISQFIPEDKLKLFSNTGYFNSLKWNERRAVLIDMAGGVDTNALIASNPNYSFIGEFLGQKKSFKEFKTQIAAERRKAKDELELIPSRIDEVQRANNSLQHPFERLKAEKAKLDEELSSIENAINNKNEANSLQDRKIDELRKERYNLSSQAQLISDALKTSISAKYNSPDETKMKFEQEIKTDVQLVDDANKDLIYLNQRIESGNAKIDTCNKDIKSLNESIADYRSRWIELNGKTITFDEKEFCCPTCKRGYEESDIAIKKQELIETFNITKKQSLDSFVEKSDAEKDKLKAETDKLSEYNEAITLIKKDIVEKEKEVSDIKLRISNNQNTLQAHLNKPKEDRQSPDEVLNEALDKNEEYKILTAKVHEIDAELAEFKPVDNSVLIIRKNEIRASLEVISKDLQNEVLIKNNLLRIEELKAQEKILSQQVADLEKKEFYMLQFSLKQMDEVENIVNKMFSYVSFKMFRTQINGEIDEDCECLVNGKPIHGGAVNTASIINAGVDIINTLSKHYNIYAPMFIDGRESVTELIDTVTQIINLIVSPAHEKLTITESVGMLEAV